MLRALRMAFAAVVLSSAFSIGTQVATAGAVQPCLPPPNLVLLQVAQVAGANSALFTDVQAVEQADATQGDKSGGQVIQDILVVVNRNGYQWDCGTSRLVSTRPSAAVASGTTQPTDAASSPPSVQVQAAPSTTTTTSPSRIPIGVIVIGLALCAGGLVIAVRRVSRH